MNKRSALIFGLLAAVLAFSLVLAGCDDPNKDNGTPNPEWPAGFTYGTSTDGKNYPMGIWSNQWGGMGFVKSSAGSALILSEGGNIYYGLKSKSGDVYTVQKMILNANQSDVESWVDDEWTFKAVLSSDKITVSVSGQPSKLANGDYTKPDA